MSKSKSDVGAAEPQVETPTVDLLGQLSVSLCGTDYMLRPSRLAISNIERATGKPLMALAAQCAGLALPVEDAGVCVAEMMRAYAAFDSGASPDYKGAKPDRCADLIYESNAVTILTRLGSIFKEALTGGYTASGEVKAAGTMTTEPTPTAA